MTRTPWRYPALSVTDYGATGDGSTDDSAAIQAALNALDPNRGGDLFFPQGRYRIATGLTTAIQGTRLMGEGLPGTSSGQAKGSSRIVVDDGITGITFNPTGSPHQTLGYAMHNLHVIAATGATTNNGVLVRDCERVTIRDVTCSDFVGGYGLKFIATAPGSSQYAELLNFSAGDCLYGLFLGEVAPNGCTMFGGYFYGQGTTPRAGSKAVYMTKGDTLRAFGVKIQGYETGFQIDPVSDIDPGVCEIHGPRFEYCNVGINVGQYCRNLLVVGGYWSNSLLGGGGDSYGVQVHTSVATDICLVRPIFSAMGTAVVDPGNHVTYATFA